MFIVHAEYEVENNKPVLYLFCREGNKRTLTKVDSFVPYFYVPEAEKDSVKGIKGNSDIYIGLHGEKLVKVYTKLPSDVPKIRDRYSRTWEADVLFPIRYLIDKVDALEPANPKVMFIDIETDNSGRVPNIDIASDAVICVTAFSNDVYTTFVFRSDFTPGIRSQVSWDCLHEVHYYRSEVELLESLAEFIASDEPDVISGWNIVRFDLPYLVNRMTRLGIDHSKLSPMNKVYIRDKDEQREVVIKGVSIIDLYDLYKKFSENLEESYRLEFIGEKVVGISKTASATNVKWMWVHEPNKLIEYNANDTRLVFEIDKKLMLLDFLDELRRLCFCNLEDCMQTSRMADSYILKLFHGKKVFPSKTKHEKYEFEGGLVESWAEGIYENVVMFDLKSLYPSIVVSLNLSLETLVDKSSENTIQIDKILVKKSPKGFLPIVIENLFKERAKYKDLMKAEELDSVMYKRYELRQRAIKTLMNALYGQTAYPNSRIYDARIAETITWTGRSIIKWSKDFLEELGYQVLYADTDSLAWVLGTEIDLEQVKLVKNLLNDSYNKFSSNLGLDSHIFSMDLEKIYRKAFFGKTKKRYVGSICYKDGKSANKLDVRGFEIRRSDAAQFSRKLQETVFDMLLRQDKSKDEVTRYIGSEIDRIRKGNFKFTELGIPKGMSKDLYSYGKNKNGNYKEKGISANIRGARYTLEQLGHELSSKPKLVYVSRLPNGYEPTDVICFDEDDQIPPGTEIDIEKMLQKLVKDKLQPIFESLGWKMNELVYHWKGKTPKGGEQLKFLLKND